MTTEPPPGSGGEPPEDDPFRKQPPQQPPHGQGQGPQGSPYDSPYGGAGGQQPPPYGGAGGQPPPYGGAGGGGPYGGDPYGGYPADPLSGMPPLADSGRRTLARIIDMVLVTLVVWLLTWGFGVNEYDVDGDGVEVGKSLAQSVVAAVLYIAYDTFMTAKSGQTLGKKWLGLRVANLDNGSTPSTQTSLVRALVLWVPFAFCCACVWTAICGGWSFFDKPYKQGLHDKAAKTVVVSTG
ncbi:RDD family protein [Streptomyces phaeoluteigriseus]|uniref:RDD family protein n=1 Tax=Streptomyces phaeoluteigriseus TaxID=114686 RepID=A0ABY4ZLL8_9ACTN|nr:RDD family protein [Streptomyces phaeoluteigriseus]USQ89777.1 RDD family protein [Streptomyces phaeoluteigriseus]